MKIVDIYTDGACSGNPGPGAWAYLIMYQNNKTDEAGFTPNTTNNRMELLAVINALKKLKLHMADAMKVNVYTDSQYVKNGITTWIHSWKKSNWRNGKIKNIDLWKELDSLASQYTINWEWVKGHSTNPFNNHVDELARKCVKQNA